LSQHLLRPSPGEKIRNRQNSFKTHPENKEVDRRKCRELKKKCDETNTRRCQTGAGGMALVECFLPSERP
jgi:hypothetical protein